MTSREIREKYLSFFESKSHKRAPGSGLVPADDPTLLFTSAGMVQFKKYWATDAPLPYTRATTCQKCLRVGGKDSDLEVIGASPKHHTFFEMLGNFSFGDYFKKEAIEWAWEFVTNPRHLAMDPNVIWVSYYHKDGEAKELWKKFLPEERLVPLGEKDNFWGPAGETGVCGPCTELYIDFGPEFSCGDKSCRPGCHCERFMEFWNLVFPQYDKQPDGSLPPLKRRGVDTGMGLERISRIMQKVPTNYDTDLFLPIIKKTEQYAKQSYDDPDKKPAFRIISDHLRAVIFLIDDGIMPSNDGRGYILRNLIRRAAIAGINIGLKDPFLFSLSHMPISIMNLAGYASLFDHQRLIEQVIKEEEEKFHVTNEAAGRKFAEYVSAGQISGHKVPGEIAFELYGTYGVRKDILERLAAAHRVTVDWEKFDRLLDEEKDRSRGASAIGVQTDRIFESPGMKGTEFLGYEKEEAKAAVQALYREREKDVYHIVLDQTPFYPERGGQQGDRGVIKNDNFIFRVADTRTDEKGFIHHIGRFQGRPEDLSVELEVTATVDGRARREISANHTATHLLHYALREVLGKEVKQAGSYVGDDKLRFDFVCFSDVTPEQLSKVETIVQEKIFEDWPVSTREMSLDEAVKSGAIALFIDKYGEKVRVVDSVVHGEVCGGTHLATTGGIGLFKITAYSGLGQNLKRIEAVTYRRAVEYLNNLQAVVAAISVRLAVPADQLDFRVKKLLGELEEKDRLLQSYNNASIESAVGEAAARAVRYERAGVVFSLVCAQLDIQDADSVGRAADRILKQVGEGVVVLVSTIKGKLFVVIKVSEAPAKLFPANRLMKEIAPIIKGGGGGSAAFSQGSGKDISCFDALTGKVKELLEKQ